MSVPRPLKIGDVLHDPHGHATFLLIEPDGRGGWHGERSDYGRWYVNAHGLSAFYEMDPGPSGSVAAGEED